MNEKNTKDIPKEFAVTCKICQGTDIANPIHRLELCKPMIKQIEGKIFFQGRLINQLMKAGFQVKTCYETNYPDDLQVLIDSCIDLKWFRVFSITFVTRKKAPTMLISPKVDL